MGNSLRNGLLITGIVAVAILLNGIMGPRLPQWDLTRRHTNTLGPQTVTLLKEMTPPIVIRAYFQPGTDEDFKMRHLLRQMDRISRHFTYEMVDIDASPQQALADQVSAYGSMVIVVGDRKRMLYYQDLFIPSSGGHDLFLGESAIATSLLVLTQRRTETVYYVTGHGEPPIDSFNGKSVSRWLRLLEYDGWTVRPLQLGRGEHIPSDSILVMAAPQFAFSMRESQIVDQFIRKGGRGLFFADYKMDRSMASLLAQWGVGVGASFIEDPESSYFKTPSILLPVIQSTPITDPIRSQELVVIMPVALPLNITRGDAKVPLAMTTSRSKAGGMTGPFAVAAAVGAGEGGFLVFGDVDWITNDMIGTPGNRVLALNAVRFLAGDLASHSDDRHSESSDMLILNVWQWRVLIGIVIGIPLLLLGLWMRVRWTSRRH